ncbi:prenyltransferase [Ruicaihuangia caeni]|uniref:prenyltransferase n=1 Tax=Ruicaihuangia caeni TaxID=3042517 RepID=UPI00338F4625
MSWTSRNTVRPVLSTVVLSSRPLSWINTAFPFAAVWWLSTGTVDAFMVLGTLFFLVPYNLLMYGLNDVFDYASDLANPRKGGAEGALVPPTLHRMLVIVSVASALPFVIALVVAQPAASPVLALSLFAVVAYSVPRLRFKEIPVLDSLTSSTHFVSPALYAVAAAGTVVTPALAAILAAFFLWGVASHAFGAVQDIEPDRSAGIRSIATEFGARATVRLSAALWAIAGLLLLGTQWPGPLAAVLTLPYVGIALSHFKIDDVTASESNRGWRKFLWVNYVCGFLVTMLLIWWSFER